MVLSSLWSFFHFKSLYYRTRANQFSFPPSNPSLTPFLLVASSQLSPGPLSLLYAVPLQTPSLFSRISQDLVGLRIPLKFPELLTHPFPPPHFWPQVFFLSEARNGPFPQHEDSFFPQTNPFFF